MSYSNPCVHCGACCAFFRVSFYWGEANPSLGGSVPAELVETIDDFHVCMKGTNQARPRCTALQGTVGKQVGCDIYDQRSSTCAAFGLHCAAHGIHATLEELARCNRARKSCGLPALPRSILLPHHASGLCMPRVNPCRRLNHAQRFHRHYLS